MAILPLVKKGEVMEVAEKLYDDLKGLFSCELLTSGSIGKRYRKMDEIGTPYCVTVDFDGLEDGTVTVRDRNTAEQKRVKLEDLAEMV
jgi:glycyl-tRNA synthetase